MASFKHWDKPGKCSGRDSWQGARVWCTVNGWDPTGSHQNPPTMDILKDLWFVWNYEEGWQMMCPRLKHRKCLSAGNSTSPGQWHTGSGNCLTQQVDHTNATLNGFEHIVSRRIHLWIGNWHECFEFGNPSLNLEIYHNQIYHECWATKTFLMLHVDNLDG